MALALYTTSPTTITSGTVTYTNSATTGNVIISGNTFNQPLFVQTGGIAGVTGAGTPLIDQAYQHSMNKIIECEDAAIQGKLDVTKLAGQEALKIKGKPTCWKCKIPVKNAQIQLQASELRYIFKAWCHGQVCEATLAFKDLLHVKSIEYEWAFK